MTTLGFDKPLYILPFDHRGSFQKKMFGWDGELSPQQTAEIAAAKRVIYDAFVSAIRDGVPKDKASEDDLLGVVLDAGAEDLKDEGDTWEIITDPAAHEAVAAAVKAARIPTVMSEVTMVASTYHKLEGNTAHQMIRLLEALEDCDDTQNVYSNFDMDAEQMEHAAG